MLPSLWFCLDDMFSLFALILFAVAHRASDTYIK